MRIVHKEYERREPVEMSHAHALGELGKAKFALLLKKKVGPRPGYVYTRAVRAMLVD